MDTIYTEWSCMAAALTAGMTLMMVYDGLRLFRLFVSHAPIWTGLEDLLYWIGAGLSVFFLPFYPACAYGHLPSYCLLPFHFKIFF